MNGSPHERAKPLVALALVVGLAAGCAHLTERSPCPSSLVVAAVGEFLGAPYRPGGCGHKGFDCSGLVQAAYRMAGLELPHSTARLAQAGRPVAQAELRPADILLFGPTSGPHEHGLADHCGIYLGEGRFAHASTSRGVIVSSLAAQYWRERFLGARRCLEE